MNIQDKIKKMVKENKIFLFMKGEPKSPQCGFSYRVVQILDHLKIKYAYFDVLNDEDIRQGIKIYGNWPTIPQLYVNGELFGGCDLVEESFKSGELEKKLS